MNTFRFRPASLVVALVVFAASVTGILQLTGPGATDGIAADRVQVKSPAIPPLHQKYLAALRKFRSLAYQDRTAEQCIRDLSRTLGTEIRLHDSVLKHIDQRGKIKFETTEPVSHQTAIRVVMQNVGIYDLGIVFEDDRLVLVFGDGYRGSSMRTYDLTSRSNFSIAERQRLIDSTLADVRPDAWSTVNATWIKPGESVYEIDVYQSQEVHEEIRQRLFEQHPLVILDNDLQNLSDVQGLSFLGHIEQKKSGKKLDKRAIVDRLRQRYAYESMADRLRHERVADSDHEPKLSVEARQRIQKADEQFRQAKQAKFAYSMMRSESLRMLHEEEVATFVGRPGAGLMRMTPPGPSYLPGNPPRNLPLASNEMVRSVDDTPVRLPETKTAAAARRVFLPSRQSLEQLHRNGEAAFLSPQRFGYIKSRNEVAGFQSHGFSFAPSLLSHIERPWYRKETELWAMHRLELVSLLKHARPAVYVSRGLPRMDELSGVKTRALSSFEKTALESLRDGEDVVTKASLNRIEMLGSLRATNQCLQCHDVKHGALLGAFSYELLRDPQLDPARHRDDPNEKPIF